MEFVDQQHLAQNSKQHLFRASRFPDHAVVVNLVETTSVGGDSNGLWVVI
jgi:hypothetical protein